MFYSTSLEEQKLPGKEPPGIEYIERPALPSTHPSDSKNNPPIIDFNNEYSRTLPTGKESLTQMLGMLPSKFRDAIDLRDRYRIPVFDINSGTFLGFRVGDSTGVSIHHITPVDLFNMPKKLITTHLSPDEQALFGISTEEYLKGCPANRMFNVISIDDSLHRLIHQNPYETVKQKYKALSIEERSRIKMGDYIQNLIDEGEDFWDKSLDSQLRMIAILNMIGKFSEIERLGESLEGEPIGRFILSELEFMKKLVEKVQTWNPEFYMKWLHFSTVGYKADREM